MTTTEANQGATSTILNAPTFTSPATSLPIYQVGVVFHHPLTDYYKTALARWKKGVLCVQEDPSPTYLKKFGIIPGPWSFHSWGKWYRLLEANGSEYLDYFILSNGEVEACE